MEAILFFVNNLKLEKEFQKHESNILNIQNKISEETIYAKSFSIYDLNIQREIYSKNSNMVLPLASLTKTMTMLIVLNENKKDNIVNISKNALLQDGDYGFSVGEKLKIEDLVKFTLISSANDGAYALSELVQNITEKMNIKAKKIGLENTYFLNPTGLDISAHKAGAYGTALDMNLLAIYAVKEYPEIFDATKLTEINLKSESGKNHFEKNTNILAQKIPNLIFSKTGFTNIAGGNLSVIFQNKEGHKIAITVLNSTFDGRFVDMDKLINLLYNWSY